MKKIFDDIPHEQIPHIGVERIATQDNDRAIAKVEKHMEQLVNLSTHYTTKLHNGLSYFRFKQSKVAIAEIEKILSDRFNFTIKLINMDNMLAAVNPTPPLNDSVISENHRVVYEHTMSKLSLPDCEDGDCKHVKRPTNVKDIKDIHSDTLDEKSALYHIYNSFNVMQKALNTDGVKVNNKKAIIEGLPKDYVIFILVDFNLGFNKYKLTAPEYTAIILHEIGHAFTYVSQSYRTVETTTVLMDTLRNELSKGKAYTPTLNLLYKKLDGKEDLSDASATTVTLKTIDLYMDITKNLDMDNPYSYTDSEQLADNFATRFGYGSHLATGLNRATYSNHNIMDYVYQVSVSSFLLTLILYMDIALALTTAILSPFILAVRMMWITRLLDIIIPEKYRKETYDRLRMRYTRVKLDIIRQLRVSDLPRDVVSRYIRDYENIDKLIENTNKDKRLSEVLASTFPWNKGKVRRKLTEQTFERLMDNKLHVSTHTLREYLD